MRWSYPQLMLNSRCTSKPLMCWAADSHSCLLSPPALSILGKAHFFTECLRKSLRNQPAINHSHPRAVNYHYLWYQPRACNKVWTFIALRCPLTSRLMQIIGLGWIFPHAGTGRVNHRAGEFHLSVRQPVACQQELTLLWHRRSAREVKPHLFKSDE